MIIYHLNTMLEWPTPSLRPPYSDAIHVVRGLVPQAILQCSSTSVWLYLPTKAHRPYQTFSRGDSLSTVLVTKAQTSYQTFR